MFIESGDAMKLSLQTLLDELKRNMKDYVWFLLFAALYLAFFAIVFPGEPNCLIKRTFGVPCPGCGMSRAAWNLLTFDFQDALFYHPLIVLMPLLAIILLFRNLPRIQPIYRSKWFWGAVVALFLIVYAIRMYLYFPDIAPMDYYDQSLLERLLP